MTTGNRNRLRFDGVEVLDQNDQSRTVKVTFTYAGETTESSEISDMTSTGLLRAAANAAMEGIQQAVDRRFTGVVQDLDHVSALGKELIAVLVNIEMDGRQFQLFGSCQLGGDETAAAIKAVLNATNRFVELASRD